MTRHRSGVSEAADLLLETLPLCRAVDVTALRCRWAALNTAGLASLTEYEGCVLWLHRRLKELDLLGAVPDGFGQWLSARARHFAARNLVVDAQRDDLVRILNELQVPHVLLKGAARRLVSDVYPYSDARRTTDVDVLLPEEVARPTWLRLQTAGFVATPDPGGRYNAHYHLPPLKNGRGVAVELHTSTSRLVPARLAWSRLVRTGQPATCQGGPTQVPGPTELLWNALSHAPLPSPYAFRTRFFQDATVVWAAGAAVDWSEIARRLASDELPHRGLAKRWLGTAARLTGLPDTASALGALPALELLRALGWRLAVFRLGRNGHREPRPVWGQHLASRGRRLLIDEGTRSELGLPPTLPRHRRPLARLGRHFAAKAARVYYRAWRLVSQLGT